MNRLVDKLKYESINRIVIFEILLFVVALISMSIKNERIWFVFIFFITIIQLSIHVIILVKYQESIINFAVFFSVLSYAFHFGHIPLKAFNITFGNNILFPLWYVEFITYKIATLFTITVHSMVFLGMISVFECDRRNQEGRKIGYKLMDYCKQITKKEVKILGIVCLAIGILPTLYINVTKMVLFFEGGYLNTFSLNVNDFVEVLAKFIQFGGFCLLIAYSEKKKKATVIFFTVVFFEIIMMSSGGRGEAIAFLLSLFIVWEANVFQLSKKKIVFLIVIGYFGLMLLNFIATIRNMEISSVNDFIAVFGYVFKRNQIFNALSEFGSTFSTVCFTIESKPSMTWGVNYILPIFLVLPNIGGFNSGIVNQMIFVNHIDTYDQPVGGSYVAELFYSFRWGGVLMAFFIGIMLGWIALQLKKKKENSFYYLICAYTMPLLFFWIRGYFGAIYRTYIWHVGFAVTYIVASHMYKKRRDGKKFAT